MKRCPHCTGAIQDDALVCPLCKTSLTGMPAPPPGASGKAIGSLVCGLLSVLILPFFASIPAVILGHISLSEIKKSAGRLQGKGMAIAGLVMGYLSVAFIPFLLIIAAIAIPNLLRARMAANEAAAVGSLRTYNSAMVNYAAICPNIGYPASVVDLGTGDGRCKGANLVDSFLAAPAGQKTGYRFSIHRGLPIVPVEWSATRSPQILLSRIRPAAGIFSQTRRA
jgi:Domain of unknown function (DUF4190)